MSNELEVSPLEAARLSQATRVLALMSEGKTQKEACEEAGITVRQFRYWVQKQGGMEHLQDLVKDSAIDALLRVVQNYQVAIDNLIKIATATEGVLVRDQLAAIKELRVILNEVALPAANKLPGALSPTDGSDPDGEPSKLAVPFMPSFLGPTTVNITPQVEKIIEVEPKD